MVKVNTHDEFLDHEVAVWGEEYIFTLLDKGYEVVQVHDGNGDSHFTWRKSSLTPLPQAATLGSGSSAELLPFLRASRL